MSNAQSQATQKHFWDDGGGFFGRGYMEGDDSVEGFLSTQMELSERTRNEIDGVIRLLRLSPGGRVLDCPCGYGRHALGLARQGFEVVGSDINGEMLAPALAAAKRGANITFAQENMKHLRYDNEFDAVINLFFSFGFFETAEENNEVIKLFHRALRPGGKFLMHTDVNVPRLLSSKYKFHEIRQLKSGKKLEIVERFDAEKRILRGQWILISPDGTREELTPYRHIVYTYDDFAEICKAAGFRTVKGYGDWQGSLLRDDSEEMMIVAEKAE